MKHNNQLPNAHFKKDWDKRVKTWFDQAGQKRRRRLLRKEKAAAIAPRPAYGLLRPVVRCTTRKYNMKTRLGRGFSLRELKEAGINPLEARSIGIAVDHRRVNKSVEGLQANVERLNAYKNKLILFPKGAKALKGDATPEEMAAATQFTGVFMPVEKTAPKIELVQVTDAMKKYTAFRGLRQARNDARHFGIRAKRAAQAKEEK